MCYDRKELANGVATEGEALGSSEEDESRVYDALGNTNTVSGDVLQTSQQQQPPSQGPVIRWETFLPFRSVKVLLVENDDSTRQVVSALLRNCSYEVTAVSNGLQAWRILEDVNTRIDLVLTEVAVPVLSGISLLCKIMSHKTFKNIPVTMMSSHDSMGLVFKCLSKGAVDFLVKPIRKNELKNLWQHVWRKCHSSSGSGSESGTQTKKSVKTESNEGSKNNNFNSSDEEGRHVLQDGSDNGSGTQSSWTKKAADIDSTPPASPSYQLPNTPDSTCAVIHAKPGTFGNGRVHVSELRKLEDQNERLDDATIRKDLQVGGCGSSDLGISEKATTLKGEINKLGKLENENLTRKSRQCNAESSVQYTDGNYDDELNSPSGASQTKGKASLSNLEPLQSLELTLTRPTDARDSRSDDRNILRHSDQSAFSKYNTATSTNKDPTGNAGNYCPRDSPVTMITGSGSGSNPLNQHQQSNGSSGHNYNTASSAKYANPKPETFRTFSSAFHPVQNPDPVPPDSQPILPENTENVRANTFNALDSTVLNCAVTGSVSGSNHGSNNGNSGSGSGNAVNTEHANGESENGAGGSGNRRIEHAVQREAALMKFRQKRKERCYEKRVRYYSRKKLAEQRPRVKGQFVRRANSKSGNECSSSGMASEDTSHDSGR